MTVLDFQFEGRDHHPPVRCETYEGEGSGGGEGGEKEGWIRFVRSSWEVVRSRV